MPFAVRNLYAVLISSLFPLSGQIPIQFATIHLCELAASGRRSCTDFAYKFIYFTSGINLYGWLARQQAADSAQGTTAALWLLLLAG